MTNARQPASAPASPDADLGVLLAACCVRVVRTLLATLGPAGYGHLTPTQAITLLFIGRGINTVTQLAERAGVTTQAMSKICAVLQADGLLDRQPHTGDARSRRLALTADGHRLHDLLLSLIHISEPTRPY